jgi:ribose/xylose/arabinose/galactoside ABC-type transport system permease subunit
MNMANLIERREFAVVAALIGLVIIFSTINSAFLKPGNLFAILRGGAFIGVMAVGVAWVLISGTFDLSTGAVAGMAAIITSALIVYEGWPIILSIVCGLLCGLIIGLVNYFLVFKTHIPAFLATIGTMFIARGISEYISKGWEIYPLPESVEVFGISQPLGLSWYFLIFVSLVIVSQLLLSFTVWGLEVKATGSDREIARLTEVNITKVSISVYVICGILAALSGILLMTRISAGKANIGTGWELQVITAVAIGGISLFGYEGSFIGMFLGILVIQTIQNGLIVIGLSPYLNTIVVGVILLFTAIIDWRRRAKLEIEADI